MSTRLTAVQECDVPGLCARVTFGHVHERLHGNRGPICLFEPHRIVAYVVTAQAGRRCFVFRTLPTDEELQLKLQGVSAPVRLLMAASGRRRTERMLELLRAVRLVAGSAENASDEFYLRASAALTRTVSVHEVLRILSLRDGLLQVAQ